MVVAKWLVEDLEDDRLRKSERRALLSGVMARSSTRDIGYGWIIKNLDELQSDSGGIFMSTWLPRLFDDFCSVEKSAQLASELGPRFAETPGALAFERTLEKVRNCGMFKDQLGSSVSEVFARLR